jgi:centrosomal protein CEP290
VKEINEIQRFDHLSSQHQLVQSQLTILEKRNSELEEKFDLVTRSNMDLQTLERELREQLITSVPKAEIAALRSQLQKVEETELRLRTENGQLREVAEVAQNQVQDLEHRKDGQLLEMEALRHQVLDLQSLTDEKALIGRLHQQLLSLQTKDMYSIKKAKSLEDKVQKLEANLIKANKRCSDLQNLVLKVKGQNNLRVRALNKVIQDLRRQYSGSIPLSKQEKLSQNLVRMNLEKQRTSALLGETENRLRDMEKKSEELELKKQGIDEIMAALKHNAGSRQVLEWHSKLEDIRLKELHFRRSAEQWEKEVISLRDHSKSQSLRIDQLEEELVKLETLLEHRQLEWESREMDLDHLEVSKGSAQEDNLLIGLEKSGGHEPDPGMAARASNLMNLPLAQQLEASFSKNKSLSQVVKELKKKLEDAQKGFEDVSKRCRELEAGNLAKERMINDLRLQVPATVDRAIAITSVIGQPGIPAACLAAEGGVESNRALQVNIYYGSERINKA